MTSKEALDNIAIEFDTMGMICSNIAYKDFWEKDLHFKEIFGCEYEIIMKDLKRLEQLEKENEALKYQNKRLLEDNDFINNQNRMLEDVVKLFKRNLYASILDNNMPKNKTEELLQLLDKVLGGIGVIYE